MKFPPWKTRAERKKAQQEQARQEWLEREKGWWRFQAGMDLQYNKISSEEYFTVLDQIERGEEYVGWARRQLTSLSH